MRKFIEEYEREALLILITMLGVTRWWMPSVTGFWNMYGASYWAISYEHGLVRRGLIGTIVKIFLPVVTVGAVDHIALVFYCLFLALLLAILYVLLRHNDKDARLFRLALIFCAIPTTLAMFAHDLGRFDLFLTTTMVLCLVFLSLNKSIWLIPLLMTTAMFIHESFMILYAPTIGAAMMFVYVREKKEKRMLATLVVSVVAVASAFAVLYKFGTPAMTYEQFFQFVQSRADFRITDLSMRECYFTLRDHVGVASSSLYDTGSIVNLFMALLILSPVILILCNLWTHALRNCGVHRRACQLFFLATLSGLIVIPIATDYGRWLSAIISCNFFAMFFLVKQGVIKTEELTEYSGDSFSLLFVLILLTYLLFGPFYDWNPYPYKDNVIYSSLSMIAVLLFDVGFLLRWKKLRAGRH